ncbi:hypothetical protein [Tenacibaculum sp. M341]|uniref:hypothetical protein n=1 Tax=Tenacibaculum sp. M341 TaxID=2530339 RepID=UPI0010526635|nr:hypothetical protein [Tenacibaculum sp. M341]TCI93643.1 hypothetical protein EYW44_04315 [Tenacibaculum sp. M341]
MSQIELNYLVFDDDPEAINQYHNKIKISGCIITPIVINPIDFYDADLNKFEVEKFKKGIIQKTKGRNINLIITDWNILPENEGFLGIKGWDIIEWVIETKEKWKSRTFLIYSSDIKKASDYVLQKIKKEIEEKPGDIIPSLEFIREIIELKIKFCKRNEQRFEEIKTLLKESNTISNVVLDSLISFDENTLINTGNSDYDGKKISEILNFNNQDIGGLKFIREFIELSIAHYSDLNE